MIIRATVALLFTIAALPAFAEESLPRVLILGDANYQQAARTIAADLKGKATVDCPRLEAGEVFNSETALRHLDTLLGDGQWDVIYFNCGLGDLVYRAPNMRSFRVLPIHAGGVVATSPEQYQSNLQQLAKRLKATGARIVWASTTPIRHSETNVFQLESEIKYNAIAQAVMSEHAIEVNDMYAHIRGMIDMNKPASHGFDPFYFDRKPFHTPVVQSILDQLENR